MNKKEKCEKAQQALEDLIAFELELQNILGINIEESTKEKEKLLEQTKITINKLEKKDE